MWQLWSLTLNVHSARTYVILKLMYVLFLTTFKTYKVMVLFEIFSH